VPSTKAFIEYIAQKKNNESNSAQQTSLSPIVSQTHISAAATKSSDSEPAKKAT